MILPSRPQQEQQPPRRSSKPDGNRSSRAAEQVANEREQGSERSARHSSISIQAKKPAQRPIYQYQSRRGHQQRRQYLPASRSTGSQAEAEHRSGGSWTAGAHHLPRDQDSTRGGDEISSATEEEATAARRASTASGGRDTNRGEICRGNQGSSPKPLPRSEATKRRGRARQPHPPQDQRQTCQEIRTTPEARRDQRRRISCRRDQRGQYPTKDSSPAATPAKQRGRISQPRTTCQPRTTAAHATTAAAYPAKPRREGNRGGSRSHEEKPAPILPRAANLPARAHHLPKPRQPPRADEISGGSGNPAAISARSGSPAANISAPARTTCRRSSTAAAGNLPAATEPNHLPQDQRGKPAAGNPEALYNKNNGISIL